MVPAIVDYKYNVEQMGMAEPPERSIGRTIGFVVYDCWPCTGSPSMTDGPLAALATQLGTEINTKNILIFIFFPYFNYFVFLIL